MSSSQQKPRFASDATTPESVFCCPFLQNVKNAEECSVNAANLLPQQTVKIA